MVLPACGCTRCHEAGTLQPLRHQGMIDHVKTELASRDQLERRPSSDIPVSNTARRNRKSERTYTDRQCGIYRVESQMSVLATTFDYDRRIARDNGEMNVDQKIVIR